MPSKISSFGRRLIEFGNVDFCPNLNRYVYWLKQPIGWFVIGLAAALMAGAFVGPQGFVLAAAIASVILLGVCWPWLSLRGVHVFVEPRRKRVTEGESLVLLIRVVNRWPIPVWGLCLERGFPGAEGPDSPWLAMTRVSPFSETEFEWQMTAPQRGVYPREVPVVSNGFPFGLWRCLLPVRLQETVLVWPKTFPLRSFPEITGDALSIEGCETLKAGQEGEVIDLRTFRVGDTLRQVHWAQTARRGILMVRERQNKSRREVRVVVDVDPAYHFGTGAQGSLEWAMRVAASICREFHAHHFHVSCVVGKEVLTAPDHQAGIKPILDGMARLRLDDFPDRQLVLRDLGRSTLSSGVLEYVITTSGRKSEGLETGPTRLKQTARNWIYLGSADRESTRAGQTQDDVGPLGRCRPIDLQLSDLPIQAPCSEVWE